jgi:hypothetical protein
MSKYPELPGKKPELPGEGWIVISLSFNQSNTTKEKKKLAD